METCISLCYITNLFYNETQYTYNVTIRRVRETITAMEKQ